MALDRFPGAARGDAHLLVVIARRPARGEGVVQPEIALLRDAVGDVGECSGALVGRHHQIGIGHVLLDHPIRGHDVVADAVFSNVQHGGNEGFIAGDALGLQRLAVTRQRGLLQHETALGADRYDHRILDLLRLGQPQNLGAEILAPVRPAQTAARHRPETQMYAFQPRAVDENFTEGPGFG